MPTVCPVCKSQNAEENRVDLNEINYLITILSEKPIKEAILLWDKIRVQAINQVQAQTPAE